jgi:chaperone modulatory protein CbpM
MRADLIEAVWVEDYPDLDLEELSRLGGLPREVVEELADCGVLAPSSPAPQWRFSSGCVATVRVAQRMRQDFELDPDTLAVVMKLVERIQHLESTVRELRAKGNR